MAKEIQMYELGYLLLPIVAEEKVSDEVLALRSAIESAGGMILEEESPKMRPLSYTMSKSIANKKGKFDQAYFGWIRYQSSSGVTPTVKEAIEKRENVLRFLIIKTIKEVRRPSRRPIGTGAVRPPAGPKDAVGEKPVMTDQDIDREIENLIGDATPTGTTVVDSQV
jgi:ribosomal protein S6